MRVLLAVLLAASALAQTAEIRGTVTERGPNTPLAGATVSLYEFIPVGDDLDARLFKTISTDARGAFRFTPGHVGDFRLEVSKPGYVTPDEGPRNPGGDTFRLQIFLDERNAVTDYRIALMVPSSLTGRVVDDDRKPVANFRVFLQPADSLLPMGRGTPAVTDADGVFTASPLPPGPYIVRIAAEGLQGLSITDYSEAESKIVDEAVETSYWPGGVSDPKSALPLPVPPGTPANIVLRKARFYRASVELAGKCAAGEQWTYSLIPLPQDPRLIVSRTLNGPCRERFLLRNLAPTSYVLAISSGEKENRRWALVPLTVTRENVAARVLLSPVTDLTVRVVAAEGTLPEFPPVRVFRPEDGPNQPRGAPPTRLVLRPQDAPNTGDSIGTSFDAEGTMIVRNLAWSRYLISVPGVPPSHYLKELRYNRQPIPDGVITLVPGGLLEIVLSNRPASISGTVKAAPNAVVLLRRWPDTHPLLEGNEPFSYLIPLEPGGVFEFRGLAPGEYRIRAAIPPLFEERSGEGEKIVLEVGENKTVELKLP
jgi:hypothetical protein